MADCIVTGIIRDVTGTPRSDVNVKISKTLGADITTEARERKVGKSGAGGVIFRVVNGAVTTDEGFIAPQGADVTIIGNFYVNGISFVSGYTVTIPASGTATLSSLVAAATFPEEGAIVQLNGVSLPVRVGTFNLSSAFTLSQTGAVANIGSSSPALSAQAANTVIAGPTSGAAAVPTARALVAADIPSLLASKISDFAAAVLLVSPAPAWGQITGTLSAQTDLQSALNAKADLASPAFTGTPTAPTAVSATSNTQLATTAFVHALITDLIGGAPSAFDTLIEISNQLATDESVVSALTTTVAGKLAKASNLSDLTDASAALTSLGFSAFGKTLIDDADASAARTTLGLGSLATQSGTFSGTSSGTNTGDQVLTSILASSISDGDTTHAPDGNSVFDALALKAPLISPSFTTPSLGVASATSETITGNGSLSTPILSLTGTWFTGGSATTTKPYVLIEPAGTASTGWSTLGTGLGINAVSGFTGNLLDLQVAGVSKLFVTNGGALTGNGLTSLGNIKAADAGEFYWSTRSTIGSPSDGVIVLRNNADSDFSRLQFGGTTSSFPALKRSTTILQGRLADDSDFCGVQGRLRVHANAAAETPTATHTLRLFDAAGTEYRVLAIPV